MEEIVLVCVFGGFLEILLGIYFGKFVHMFRCV